MIILLTLATLVGAAIKFFCHKPDAKSAGTDNR